VRQQLEEASNRVFAIARAHEHLYGNEEIAILDFGAYLREVCRDLNVDSSGHSLEVVCEEGIRLATDRAIPLALIAIELVTNAVKYAYPDGVKGRIRLTLAKRDQGEIELRIADDGVGLPPGFDMRAATGLGMRIVRALAEQLAARVEARARNPGTEFILVAPLAPKN
jgi:two-component sensor histidine kinase